MRKLSRISIALGLIAASLVLGPGASADEHTGSISGTITAASSGAPLEGICIYASAQSPGGNWGEATSAGDGTYEITNLTATESLYVSFYDCRPQREYLEQTYNGRSEWPGDPVVVAAGSNTSDIDAAMVRGGALRGRVTSDNTGLPIEGICIEASGTFGWGYSQSDADGNWRVGALSADDYRVSFYDCRDDREYIDEWYDDSTDPGSSDLVHVDEGSEVADLDAGLRRGARITGTVTDRATSAPITSACLTASDENGIDRAWGHPREDGSFVLGALRTGTFKIRLEDCGQDRKYLGEWYDGADTIETALSIATTEGQDTAGIQAHMSLGGSIAGVVTDQVTGAPIERLCVTAVDASSSEMWRTSSWDETGIDGSYSLGALRQGSYKVRFADCGMSRVYREEWFNDRTTFAGADEIEVDQGQQVSGVDARLSKGGKIEGTVTAKTSGALLPNICISAWSNSGADYAYGFDRTDASGHYQLGGLKDGFYNLEASDCSWPGAYARTRYSGAIQVVEGSVVQADLQMEIAGRITGRITDSTTGLPLASICIMAFERSEDEFHLFYGGSGNSDQNGNYQIPQLSPGDYYLEFRECGEGGTYLRQWYSGKYSAQWADPVSVGEGGTTSDIDVAMEPVGTCGDADSDGLTDCQETPLGTDPNNADTDSDGLNDGSEVNDHRTNPLDADSDDDGLSDGDEVGRGTNPRDSDTDDDGLGDGEEVWRSTNPSDPDTDDDALSDGEEVTTYQTNPLWADTDNDGLTDGEEVRTHGTNPLSVDTDGDSLGDGDEVNVHRTNPTASDTDGDRLTDGEEVNVYRTDPLRVDTDGDSFGDGFEVEGGTCAGVEFRGGSDPNDATSTPVLATNIQRPSLALPTPTSPVCS